MHFYPHTGRILEGYQKVNRPVNRTVNRLVNRPVNRPVNIPVPVRRPVSRRLNSSAACSVLKWVCMVKLHPRATFSFPFALSLYRLSKNEIE